MMNEQTNKQMDNANPRVALQLKLAFSVLFIGRACDPTTKCKYWTYRHGERRCYLLKSCCRKGGNQGFQSGDNNCPII